MTENFVLNERELNQVNGGNAWDDYIHWWWHVLGIEKNDTPAEQHYLFHNESPLPDTIFDHLGS